jgi:serine/threonine-protein kinase
LLTPDSLVLDGRFRILRPLAQGGMGDVYLAEQVSLGRRVALKELRRELRLQPGMAERFAREARLLSSVDHPSVVRVIDYGHEGESSMLVMEYAEGRTLASALAAGALAVPRALGLLLQLAEGLTAIHAAGIVHRDLKPENVVLAPSPVGEQARLLDFGIARLAEASQESGVSQVGMVLGTPEYLSPEQATGGRADFRSDLYCFGVVAYRVLAGVLPFPGPSPRSFLAQHVGTLPTPLAVAAPALAAFPALCQVVMKCLEKDPSRRPASARALVELLRDPRLLVRRAGAAAGPVQSAGGGGPAVPPVTEVPWSTTGALEADRTPGGGTLAFGAGGPAGDGPSRGGTLAFGGGAAVPAPAAPFPAPLPAAITAASAPRPAALGAPTAPGMQAPPAGTPPWALAPANVLRGAGGAGGAGGVSLASGRVQNLTVMLTDIAGFTAQTSLQTREENARLLETHDRLLLPLVRRHGGRLVQKRGDALLVAFPSPTNAVHCGMAIQDRLWRHNAEPAGEPVVRVRVVLHAGDVLVDGDALVGEPLEVLEQVEKEAGAGEVLFTEAVNLSRNRAEAAAEEHGALALASGGQLRLYRCKPAAEGAPFGGRDRPARAPFGQRLAPLLARARTGCARAAGRARHAAGALGRAGLRLWGVARVRGGEGLGRAAALSRAGAVRLRAGAARLRAGAGEGWARLRARAADRVAAMPPRTRLWAGGGAALALLLVLALASWQLSAGARARRLLEGGQPAEALAVLDAAVRRGAGPAAHVLRARALHALGRHREELAELRGLTPAEQAAVDAEALTALAEDFGRGERNAALRELLVSLPAGAVDEALLELAAEEEPSLRQWGALRFLDGAGRTLGDLSLPERYVRALDMSECPVRSAAARRLGELGDLKALAPLTRLAEARGCGREEAAAALRALERKAGQAAGAAP